MHCYHLAISNHAIKQCAHLLLALSDTFQIYDHNRRLIFGHSLSVAIGAKQAKRKFTLAGYNIINIIMWNSSYPNKKLCQLSKAKL